MSDELAFLPIAECAARIERGDLSPVDLVEATLARIEKLDPVLNAFITVTADEARAEAQAAEREIRAGNRRSALHGVPVGLKDIYYTRGVRTTGHSRLRETFVPEFDATAFARLKQAGAILVGKLSTHEFAHGGPSFDLPWPPARNPWNPDHFTGGSSSGSGAAVAAGLVKGALGTDTGGSIRSPAGLCGIAGLKPTYGRVSRHGVFPNAYSLDHCGPMARTVADCAHLLQAIAGHDPVDPASAARPVDDYLTGLPDGIKGLRIGVVRHFYETDMPAAPEVVAAMDHAVSMLVALGAQVSDVKLAPLEDYAACKMILQLAELYAIYEADLKARPEMFGADFRFKVMPGALVAASDYVHAQRRRRILAQEVTDKLDDFDLLVTSGIYGPAPTFAAIERAAKFDKPSITVPFNITGHPALSLCAGFADNGLPYAMQIIGRAFDEATVLRAGRAYEQAAGWHKRKPDPLAARAAAAAE